MKSLLIVILCSLRNRLFLVKAENEIVATFQTRRIKDFLYFEKLATLPVYSGKGIGSFCLASIEKMAVDGNCFAVTMEVYVNSEHALSFYEHKGYTRVGDSHTIRHSVVVMKKELDVR